MNINIFEIFKNEYFTFILYAKFEAINFFYFIVKIVLQILLLLFAILQIILHMEEIFEHLNIFSYILLILNPIAEGLNFLPSHDWGMLWSISRLLANIIEEEVSLTKTLWKEKIELYILILLVTENFFTYNDCLLLLSEMNNLETSLNFKYFNLNTLIPALFDDQNNFFTWNTSLYLHLNKLINTNPAANPTFPVHQFTENQKFYDFFSDQICHKKTKECNLNSARRLDNLSLDIGNEFYKIFFFTQLFFLNLAILFFKKKIFFFFLLNLLIFALMLINLVKLATATNLIYSLIHFLFFAILSGLMIIFWGSTYIGFCVLLIYGAAIPVLALYIIMLVNVDLIQRLFFIEHTTNKTFFSRLKFAILLTIGFFGIFIVIYQLLNYKPSDFIIDHLQTMLFYLLLSKWYLKTTNISYSTESIYDLPLTFYYSDIDKVASAAFWFSYNELIALVLLLLISIIVVIGISWSSKKIDWDFYESKEINFHQLNKIATYWATFALSSARRNHFIYRLFKTTNLWHAWQNYRNSYELLYFPYTSQKISSMGNLKHEDMRYFLADPYTTWFGPYYLKWLTWFVYKHEEFLRPLPFGTQNKHPDDYYFEVNNYGLTD